MVKSTIKEEIKDNTLLETVTYPNGGKSYFYNYLDTIIIVDENICSGNIVFPYSLITEKQNFYMNRYAKVYRYLIDDIDTVITESEEIHPTFDRSNSLDVSPLEFLFEKNFCDVYGMSSLKYLTKEYGITDHQGNTYYLDYVVNTVNGMIAVEENGIHYHHPQIIGLERYRKQLQKQNACTDWNIKLYRFSTEDCNFNSRIEDDIKTFFGDSSTFIENGIKVDRPFQLYEHQENTLKDIQAQREKGIHSFLVVFPTASGKSKIIEEDIKEYNPNKTLILAPTTNIVSDWKERVKISLPDKDIRVSTYVYMTIHYMEFDPTYYDYIVIDEAHHAVAPTLRRVVEYFVPSFLIGLTATDQRPDKKRLEDIFGSYKTSLSMIEAMEKKIIAQANVYRIETNLDLRKVRFNGKDYVNADLEKNIRVTSRNELIADVLQQYFCDGEMTQKQGLVFCVNRAHTKEMEKVLNNRGISAKSYVGGSSDSIMESFKNKEIRFLCVCDKVSEGWDYPELGILVMARPTLSKVLYVQQIGRGLRKTKLKDHVFIIDVVDEYGAMAKPCSMHSIFQNPYYVPFGNITSTYKQGDLITVDGLHETVNRIVEVDIESFEDKYGDYLNPEQMAREFFISTSSINNWIRKKKIVPDAVISFGTKKIHLFSPESVERIRIENNIQVHNDETIRQDFFAFLEERDYSLSYKMPFLLSFIKHLDSIGDASIDEVLDDYIAFYQDRIDKGLVVDRKTCPYNSTTLKDRKMIKQNMLTNPFEKFERKRFLYYSKDLNVISMNHALFEKLTDSDYETINKQMHDDLEKYYSNIQ